MCINLVFTLLCFFRAPLPHIAPARKLFADTIVDGKISSTGRRYLKHALDVIEYYGGREGDNLEIFMQNLMKHKKLKSLDVNGILCFIFFWVF